MVFILYVFCLSKSFSSLYIYFHSVVCSVVSLFSSSWNNSWIMFGFICDIHCFICFHPCLVPWNLHTHISYWSPELHQYVISPWVVGGKHETNVCTGREAGRETLYVLICDSRGSCKSPRRIFGFLYVFFYIFLITSVSHVSSNVTLWLQKSISLSALLFIRPTYFIFNPPLILLPSCLFLPFLPHFCFPKSHQMCPYYAL